MLWGYFVAGSSGAVMNINVIMNYVKYQDISVKNPGCFCQEVQT